MIDRDSELNMFVVWSLDECPDTVSLCRTGTLHLSYLSDR